MIQNLLTKEEEKLFCKKRWKKIAKKDYLSYIHYHQDVLDSLCKKDKESKIDNKYLKRKIDWYQKFVYKINEFYYENIISKPNVFQDEMYEVDQEFLDYEKEFQKMTKELTRELNRK